jgi:hypothetical protein
MRTQAELDYLRAKARWKLERQLARQERNENSNPTVAVAALVFGLLLLFIGVAIVTNNNPWRTNPAPLQPIPSTTPTTPTSELQAYPCPQPGYPDRRCMNGVPLTPGTTATIPPTMQTPTNPPLSATTTPTTTSPFPTELLCDAIRPKPPNCPVTSPVPTVPGVPGSRQGQTI